MSQMVKADCTDCVMEVSSHALELSRVADLDFNVGVFTNITSDHLDFHSTFENYLSAKKIFFDQLSKESRVVFNKDDQNYETLLKDCKASAVSYSLGNSADLEIQNVNYTLDGTSFNIIYKENSYEVKTKLIGQFNAYNATAAIGAALSSGITIEKSIDGIYNTPQVPGRFEVLSSGNKKVIIDYSHTADSLEQALKAIRHIVNNDREVYTVFGCGGDRDKTKRPIMGKIAERLSDFTFVTSDNPRTENPMSIINEIKTGMSLQNHKVVEDREEAIKSAIEQSPDHAVIQIAGKGHENYQEINGIRDYFSDKETAQKYL
jgi:UDP-N-acetylmuramoyl-L-alanyl-D-glutamate--2,6-diaminopimelate ligase